MSDWMSFGSTGEMNESNFSIINTTACMPIPAYQPTFIRVLQVCVDITCILSMLGTGLIIGTFIAYKTLRTKARQILVMLSIADFLVAASQLAGVNINLPKYAKHVCREPTNDFNNISRDIFCEVQGGITIFSTTASLLWTIAVAVYLLTIIVFESQRIGKFLMYIFYPLCWGLPVIIVVTLGTLGYLGFHENVDKGWCYLKATPRNVVAEVFSQIFIYLTYITLIVIYVWIRCAIRSKIKQVSVINSKLVLRTRTADIKLTFIPLIFVFLRMWGTILGIAYIYLKNKNFRKTNINAGFVLLAAIGSSAQGLMNALLFCLFTSVVRQKLVQAIKRCVCCYNSEDPQRTYLLEDSTNKSEIGKYVEDTTQYDDEGEVYKDSLLRSGVTPHPTAITNHDSIEGSKYHSMSVGKRITTGTE